MKITEYLNHFFKKFNFWLIFFTAFLLLYWIHATEKEVFFTRISFFYSLWGVMILLGFSTLKKKMNPLDLLNFAFLVMTLFAGIIYVDVFSYLFFGGFTLLLICRLIYYDPKQNIKDTSKRYFTKLNYRFPLMPVVIISIALVFILYYVGINVNGFDDSFKRIYNWVSFFVPLLYIVLASVANRKKINFIDYFYCAFVLFTFGEIVLMNLNLLYLIAPFICLIIRAYLYKGDVHFQKKKYVSDFMLKYSPYFGCIISFFVGFLCFYTFALKGIFQMVFFIIVAFIGAILEATLILSAKWVKKEIYRLDYILFSLMGSFFFILCYFVGSHLGIKGFSDTIYENIFSLVALGLIGIEGITVILMFFVRYRCYMKKTIIYNYGQISISDSSDVEQNFELEIKNELDFSKLNYLGRLAFSNSQIKCFYVEVKNYFLSYGLTCQIKSELEVFKKDNIVGQITLNGDKFIVYLAMDSNFLIQAGYHIKDVTKVKEFQKTPSAILIDSLKALEEFKDILDLFMQMAKVSKKGKYVNQEFINLLYPSGQAILNALNYPKNKFLTSVNVKTIPLDLPNNLKNFVPKITLSLQQDEKLIDVYLDSLCNYFNEDELITVEALIEKKLIKKATGIVVHGKGTLNKRLCICANDFDDDAIKMLYITQGTAIKIERN